MVRFLLSESQKKGRLFGISPASTATSLDHYLVTVWQVLAYVRRPRLQQVHQLCIVHVRHWRVFSGRLRVVQDGLPARVWYLHYRYRAPVVLYSRELVATQVIGVCQGIDCRLRPGDKC